jgi:hypothetical protein
MSTECEENKEPSWLTMRRLVGFDVESTETKPQKNASIEEKEPAWIVTRRLGLGR